MTSPPIEEFEEFDEVQYMAEQNAIEAIWPTAKFTIGIDFEDLDEVVDDTHSSILVICDQFWSEDKEYVVVNRREGANSITNRDIINQMVEKGIDKTEEDHNFLEGFENKCNNIYVTCFGS